MNSVIKARDSIRIPLLRIADADDVSRLQNYTISMYRIDSNTLNTPYAQGRTGNSNSGILIEFGENYAVQLVIMQAAANICMWFRYKHGSGSIWDGMAWTNISGAQ